MSADILLERRDGGAHVTFNRPAIRNAISREMLADLCAFLRNIHGDESVRYLIFRGEGAHFAAGGDVASFVASLDLSPEERRSAFETRVTTSSETCLLLARVDVPIITVARGAVAGAGLLFVMAADFCFASEDAFFVFAHAKLGLPLDMGTSYYLPRVVGWRQARALALTSARIDAKRAEAIGLIGEVLAEDVLEQRVAATIAQLSAGPREAFRLSRALIDASYDNDLPSQLANEVRAVGEAVAHPDFTEGVRAFMEQRKPRFGSAS